MSMVVMGAHLTMQPSLMALELTYSIGNQKFYREQKYHIKYL